MSAFELKTRDSLLLADAGPYLLELGPQFPILCYYGDLGLQVTVNRAVAEIGRANERETRPVLASQVEPQTCCGDEENA